MRTLAHCGAFLLLAFPCVAAAVAPLQADSTDYSHAYYLFVDGVQGCENCYVPLLITKRPLDEVAKSGKEESCVLIITYERDSIWRDDGIVSVTPQAIQAPERVLHLRDKKFRYQEIAPSEVIKLLENPVGTIPISRPLLPNATTPGPTFEDLISAFRHQISEHH